MFQPPRLLAAAAIAERHRFGAAAATDGASRSVGKKSVQSHGGRSFRCDEDDHHGDYAEDEPVEA
jgi:hypothetical protein